MIYVVFLSVLKIVFITPQELCRYFEILMTSSNGNIVRVTGLCPGNSPVTGEVPAQSWLMRSFDVFFDLRRNEGLSKQSWSWWFETPSRPLRRHSKISSHVTPSSLTVLCYLELSNWQTLRLCCKCYFQRLCKFCSIRKMYIFLTWFGMIRDQVGFKPSSTGCWGISWKIVPRWKDVAGSYW